MTTAAENRTAAWLQAWDGQGIHRTATAGDAAGAAWLAEAATGLGTEPFIEEFTLDRLDPGICHLEIEGTRIDAVPAFDAPAAAAVEARLGTEIAVAELSPRAVYSGEYSALRGGGGHRGLVVICAGENPGMALLNAEQFNEPYGAPAIHVASEARELVLAAAARGAEARIVAESRRTRATAQNVLVALPGRDPTRPPLVVMTPRSSWWQSTAERGGGLVCWLETLRALIAEPPGRTVILVATSGHELGHLGLDDFLDRRPGWEQDATWVHYGANIGAAGGALLLMSASDDLRALARNAPAGIPAPFAAKTAVPSGETRDIHRAGGTYLTLVGTNPLFHLPQDRWPHAVDVALIARVAAAAAGLVIAAAR